MDTLTEDHKPDALAASQDEDQAAAPTKQPQDETRPRLDNVSYSALCGPDFPTEAVSKMFERPVWIEALGKEGAVRVLKTSEELAAQAWIYAPDAAEGTLSSADDRARRAARNRRRILLALQLCAVAPSFTAKEAAEAIEAPESALIVGPLFNAAATLNSIFQLEPLEDADHADDPELLVVKAQARAGAILQFEKQNGQLHSVLARSRYDVQVSSAVQPALDQAELFFDLLTSPRLGLLDRLAKALAERNAPPTRREPLHPAAPTSLTKTLDASYERSDVSSPRDISTSEAVLQAQRAA